MSVDMVEVLSSVNDPDTVRKILDAAGGVEEITNGRSSLDSEPPSLKEMYNRFLNRRNDRSPSTRAQYKRTLPVFMDFANDRGISSPVSIDIDTVDSFVDGLQTTYEADATILTYTKNVRTWLKWITQRGYSDESVYKILDKKELGLSPKARDEALPSTVANSILDDLGTKRRGSTLHAVTEVFWNGGPRIGGVHSLDMRDFNPKKSELRFRHRPLQGTRLKNGEEDDGNPGDGERNIEIKESVVEALKLYVERDRPPVTDGYGREPLFATKQGRASKSTIRRWVYQATSCQWGRAHSKKPDCDGSCDPNTKVCNYSYYPHALRRGAIVHHLSNGLRIDRASERFDVSIGTIRKHYDPRTKHQRKEDRKDAVRNAW